MAALESINAGALGLCPHLDRNCLQTRAETSWSSRTVLLVLPLAAQSGRRHSEINPSGGPPVVFK